MSRKSGCIRLLSFLSILETPNQTPDEVQALPQTSHSARFDHTDAARLDKAFRHLNAESLNRCGITVTALAVSWLSTATTLISDNPSNLKSPATVAPKHHRVSPMLETVLLESPITQILDTPNPLQSYHTAANNLPLSAQPIIGNV
jgi:hypothetical protein